MLDIIKAYNPFVLHTTNFEDEFWQETLYWQLPLEENARKCAYQYAKDLLISLKKDPLCKEKTLKFLEETELMLADYWKEEIKGYDKSYYAVRRNYNYTMEKVSTIPYEEMFVLPDADMAEHLIQNRLAFARKNDLSAGDFFKELFGSGRLFDEELNIYKGINKDIKKFTFNYLTEDKNITQQELELLFYYIKQNNKSKEKIDFIDLEDLPNICESMAKNNNFKPVSTFAEAILSRTIHPNSKTCKWLKPYISSKQAKNIYWQLVNNQELNTLINQEINIPKEQRDDKTYILLKDLDDVLDVGRIALAKSGKTQVQPIKNTIENS